MAIAAIIYLTGVAIGLSVMRDGWPLRLITALAWPLGPLAFVVVIGVLLTTALFLWPIPLLALAAVAALAVYAVGC